MKKTDINKLHTILTSKKRQDLADLIGNSTSCLEESNTFGSRYNSTLSTFHIKSHSDVQEKIDELSEEDKSVIFQALLLIYPLRDNEPEITEIIYYIDFDIVNLVETKELDRISFDYIHEQIKKCKKKLRVKTMMEL